jgi:hypothetical protein
LTRLVAIRSVQAGGTSSDDDGANGHRVLESLFDRPIISVADAQQVTGTGFAPANQLVARMTELGIMREMTGNACNRRFRYEPDGRLFTDPGGWSPR